MKLVATIVLGVCFLCPTGVLSETTGIMLLTEDAAGTQCNVSDTGTGVVQVHMIMNDVIGLSAVQFGAPKPDCWTGAFWLEDVIVSPVVIGDTQFNDPRGISIAGIGCLDGPVYLGYMSFFSTQAAPPCCEYPIVKVPTDQYPGIEGPIMILCSSPYDVIGATGLTVLNGNSGCTCATAVSTEESTWGRMKALYQ